MSYLFSDDEDRLSKLFSIRKKISKYLKGITCKVRDHKLEELADAPRRDIRNAPRREITEAPCRAITDAPRRAITDAPRRAIADAPYQDEQYGSSLPLLYPGKMLVSLVKLLARINAGYDSKKIRDETKKLTKHSLQVKNNN